MCVRSVDEQVVNVFTWHELAKTFTRGGGLEEAATI